MPRAALTLPALMLLAVPAAAREKPDDVAEARAALVKYYEALARKDLDAVMGAWSSQLRDPDRYRAGLKKWLDSAERITFKKLDVLKAQAAKDSVRLRVRLELAGVTADGKPAPDFGVSTHLIGLAREKGAWKVKRIESPEAPLARALAAAKTPEERTKLLAADKEVVNRALIDLLTEWGNDFTKADEAPEAMLYFDAAIAAGEAIGRVQLGWCYANRGSWWNARGRFDEALADLGKALEVQRAAKNRRGEAAMLFNLGHVSNDAARYRQAVDFYEQCLALYRDLNDRAGELSTLNSLGVAYESQDRLADALRCYEGVRALAQELKDAQGESFALTNAGNVLARVGDYRKARENFEAALAAAREQGRRDAVGTNLINLGKLCRDTGRYADALGHLREALATARELKDRPREALALGHLGDTHEKLGDYAEALRCHRQSLDLRRELRDRRGEAAGLHGVGSALAALGRYAEAQKCIAESLEITRELRVRSLEAIALAQFAQFDAETGRDVEARRHYEESLKVHRELKNPSGESACLTGLGILEAHAGRYGPALERHEAALAIVRRLGNRAGEAVCLSNIANVYQKTGRYADALQYQRDALKTARDIGKKPSVASTLTNLGLLLGRMGRNAEALELEQESLGIYRAMGDLAGEAHILVNLGATFQRLDRLDEALAHKEAALKIARALKDRTLEARVLWGIGMVLVKKERAEEALKHFEDALKSLHELGDRDGEAGLLDNIGGAHLKAGRTREALAVFEKALAIARVTGNPHAEAFYLRDVGNARLKAGASKEAAEAFAQAVAATEKLRTATRDPELQASVVGEHASPYHGLALARVQLGEPASAFAASERLRARSLLDLLAGAKLDVRKGMTGPELTEDERLQARLTSLEVRLEGLRSRRADAARVAELRKELEAARRERDDFRRDLYLRRPEVREFRADFAPAALGELGRDLFARRPGLVALSYLVGEEETLLFALTAGEKGGPARLAAHRIKAGEKAFEAAVAAFRKACESPTLAPDGAELHRLLLGPVEEQMKRASHVVVVADGPLVALPFHALRAGEDSPYLIERCAVSYASSLTVMAAMQRRGDELRRKHGEGKNMLAVGIGDFGRRARRLPGAEPEARAVAKLFGTETPLLGPTATPAALRGRWAGARYLHFATHGVLNEASPFYSAVLLGAADGVTAQLYARDLLEADLAAELVVLSACETALGQRVSGEGVLGLGWAWFVAGVPGVVAGLWQVEDASAAKLMAEFWEGVKGGKTSAEALRSAQRGVLKDPKTRHPFYWAPFALYGELGG
jgi:CHAT domain-containing protein/tetratricopeptide (TPR) repeat protein